MIGYKHVGAALLVGCLAVGCDFSMQTNATKAQLPTLAGYRQHEGEQLTNQLGDNTILQTLLGGQPQLAFVADIITNVGTCAQENGAVNWRAYVNNDDPSASGVVVIASQRQATNPAVILECSTGVMGRSSGEFSPCSDAFKYTTADDTYYVFYGATKQSVCAAFAQALPDPQ